MNPLRTRTRVHQPDADAAGRALLVAAARDLLRDEGSDTFVSAGGEIVGVLGHQVRDGRISVRVESAWTWPNDEPDAVGEVVISARHTCTAVQLVGWWTPESREAGPTLVLDLAEARLRSGVDVLCLEDDEAISALLA